MLFGKGCPFEGSLTILTALKKGVLEFSSSLKSPCRISKEGTVVVLFDSCRNRIHSSDRRKNSLLLPVLNFPGMKIGPPKENPGWLKRKGAGWLESDALGLWFRVQVLASRAEL